MSKRGGNRKPGPGKSLGRPTVDNPKTYSDYVRPAIEQPLDGYPNGKAAIKWFTDMSPLERLLAIVHAYNEAHAATRRQTPASGGEARSEMEAYRFIRNEEELKKFIEEEKEAIIQFAADPAADRNWYSKAIRKECERRKEWLWKQVDRWHEANKVQAK